MSRNYYYYGVGGFKIGGQFDGFWCEYSIHLLVRYIYYTLLYIYYVWYFS